MMEKLNFMVFRGQLVEEKSDQFKIIKKSIMAAQKCKNIWLQAALKDF